MTRSDIIRSLTEEYARLRERNLREHDRRLSEIERQDPRIAEIARESVALFMRQGRISKIAGLNRLGNLIDDCFCVGNCFSCNFFFHINSYCLLLI